MDRKRGLISFILVFTFVILSLSLISSTTCSVVPIASCPAVNTVMKLSSTTNAHGELYSQTNYPQALCCFGMTYYSAVDNASMHTCMTSPVDNKVLKLSSTTNAHAEILASTYYNTNVCFGYFSCTHSLTGSCPSNFPIQVASLSATTNAHLAQYSGYNNVKICCSDNAPAVCGNGIIESGETCDCGPEWSCTFAELGGTTCATLTGNPTAIGTPGCSPPTGGCALTMGSCCIPETNTAFCTRLGKECGSLTALDNCGTSRTVASCGTCTLPETCQSGTCVCTAETDAAFCTRLGATCGSLTGTDNCGNTRTVASCGTCSDSSLCTTDTCSSNSCVYTPITCNDGNICTGDSCNPLVGCTVTLLTGPACTDDGNPCTLDMCSLGVCTHPAISNCCTLNSQCNDNNACTGPDTCNLGTHTCSNPTIISCTGGDGCCPSGCSISTDNDCTTCTVATQQADCNDNNACTTQVCSGIPLLCSNPPITSCTGGDGCCPSGCNAVTDSDCTAVCGNGVRENPPELCDGSQLGGATCASLLAGYTGTLSCYPAGHPDQCEYNTTGCIPPCVLNSARWSPIGSVLNGTSVQLIVTGTDCSGKSVRFDIFEKDGALNSPDSITTGTPAGRNPANTIFPAGGTLTVNWVSWYIDDTDGGQTNPPEYFFNATIVGGTSSVQSLNSGDSDPNLLTVTLPVTCTDTCSSLGYTCGIHDICGISTDCGVCPPTCTLLSATWNVETILDGENAELVVEASNCDGEEITFEIYEQDTVGDDLITPVELTNINSYSSSNDNGIWRAEYISDTGAFDDGGDPEFYFIASVTGSSEEEKSNTMTVLNAGACVGITSCADYSEALCNRDDSCGVEEVGQTGCGITPDFPMPGCTLIKDCYCVWNSALGVCQNAADISNPCTFDSECGNGRLDAGEICDGTFLQLSDSQCSHFDEYTIGTISCYAAGTPYECTYNFEGCGPQSCGNGVREVGEECDDWNNVNGDGCDSNCLNEDAPYCGDGIVNQASEVCDISALQLTDDSCTHFDAYTSGLVDCYAAGTPYECTYDFSDCADQDCGNDVVESGEECEPPNANGCDANCLWESGGGTTEYVMGTCKYTSSSPTSCSEGVTFITVTSVGTIEWDISNEYTLAEAQATGLPFENFMEDPIGSGVYRYYIPTEYNDCLDTKQQVVQCPATVELPFFGIYQVVIAIALVGLIYLVYVLRKNDSKSKKSNSSRKSHKRK